MPGIDRLLNTSKEALLSHITAINITGSNVANVNTPGYSRLRPIFGSVGSVGSGSPDQMQVGVKITSVERIYDKYLEVQLVLQEHEVGYNEVRRDALSRVEGIFNESNGGGINEILNEFWDAWADLSANPAGKGERDVLVSISQNMAAMFQQQAGELQTIQQDANKTISDTVDQLNTYLEDMTIYNNQISQIEVAGGSAADLRDKRAELLRKMSNLIDFNYIEESNGTLNVFISNGRTLVQGGQMWELAVEINPANNNFYDITFADTPGVAINSRLTGGKLAGLIDIRDTTVAGYISDLDTLAASVISTVNTQHSLGFDATGNIGGNFFNAATKAEDMAVSSAIIADGSKIAASATVNGDGENAKLISAVRDQLVLNGATVTINGYYSAFVGRIGQNAADANAGYDRQKAILNQYESQKETVSGVSLDEEMLNLTKLQMGYNAAGRLLTTVNDMIDILFALGE
ncbi:MAG: flagellar hook-associated protein FlgK [Deltaproteobacteria bacterium]|nr:flagellar hook-associated protein FlgK [Deltaproteobacteria bacterium]